MLLKDPSLINKDHSNPEHIASLNTETIPAIKPDVSDSGIYPYNNPCPGWHPEPRKSLFDRMVGMDIERIVGRLILAGIGIFTLAIGALFLGAIIVILFWKVVGLVVAIK